MISPASSFRSSSTATFRCGSALTSARNSSDRMEMSGFFSPAAAKMSITSSGAATAFDTNCRMAWSSSSSDLPLGLAFTSAARTAWKNATSSRMRFASSWAAHRANACDSSLTAWQYRDLPSSWARMCSCAGGSSASRCAGVPVVHFDQSNPCNMPQQTSYFSSITATASSVSMRGLPLAAALGVGGQRLLQLVGQPQVIDHQPARLVAEHAVDAGDGLHQPVAPHRLVQVHRVQAGGVEPGEPHVADDHDLERVVGVLEPLGQLAAGVPCCGCAAASPAGRTRSPSSRS